MRITFQSINSSTFNRKFFNLVCSFQFLIFFFCTFIGNSQVNAWTLWAKNLPSGVYPKLSIAKNHDIYFGLTGTPGEKGILYKSNTMDASGSFSALPKIPLSISVVNNIQTIICNLNNEPIVGIFRNNASEPFLFRFDLAAQIWQVVEVDHPPVLGAFCSAISENGTIWIGAKWSYVYRSMDDGQSFERIDESGILKKMYPCYYPSWNGNPNDGAIYSINVDKNGRVFAGTEGAGIIYSEDQGTSWHPADFFACKTAALDLKDTNSVMKPLSHTGNLGALGFTNENNLVFNGTNMWQFNWSNCLGFADFNNHTVTQSTGLPAYLITGGLQVTKIVTTDNGRMFLHSGNTPNAPGSMGIYTSTDGIRWQMMNNGLSGINASFAQAEGSLAVDGNKVFMATTDGKIWMYDAEISTHTVTSKIKHRFSVYPNPTNGKLYFETPQSQIEVFNLSGMSVYQNRQSALNLNLENLDEGVYLVKTNNGCIKVFLHSK